MIGALFVWGPSDVLGLALVGFFAGLFLIVWVMDAVSKLRRRWRSR